MSQLTQLDAILTRRLALPTHSAGWRRARLLAHLGDGPNVFGLLLAGYGLGWLLGSAQVRQAVVVIALTVLAAMLAVTGIKFAVRRRRPVPPGEFVTFQYDKYSFPSGHAARTIAFALAAIFFYPLVGAILVVVALAIALARIAVGVHYVSDVLAGLLVGGGVAWLVVSLLA
ncbi:MAG: hypothetical protein FOGNACKC_01648 [Anaerolineae bacterium]|nr:hypothetical protein [Anaerolineae bacterium]